MDRTTYRTLRVRRGRGLGLGLAVLGAAACGVDGPGPVSRPSDDFASPTVEETADGVRRVTNSGPAEELNVYDALPARAVTLLFLDGRAATPREDGSVWADLAGARLIVFDGDGVVEHVLAERPPDGPALAQPAYAAIKAGGYLAVEGDGSALCFETETAPTWLIDPPRAPMVGGGRAPYAAARSVFDIQLLPLPAGAPLFWAGEDATALRPVGAPRETDQAMLAPLANTGWVAPAEDGSVAFASAVRAELSLFARDGVHRWTATWPHEGAFEPVFGVSRGTLVPRFRLTHQALAWGPDGRLYALVTRGADGPADRLLVFDRDGRLHRSAPVDPTAAIYVAASGHVYATPKTDALARTDAVATPRRLEPFVLPSLLDDGEVSLEEHRGKVVVVNFWASWCAPCRQEMPLLDDLAAELDPAQAIVIGLNEDVNEDDALGFLDELGGVGYPVAAGRGRLRAQYGYRGLPYTLVLDRQGRIVTAFYGFGASIEPIRSAVLEALGSGGAPGANAPARGTTAGG